MSERFNLWLTGLNPKTAKLYGGYLTRLFKLANLTPDQALEGAKKDIQAYVDLTNLANKFTPRGRHLAIFALRRYLYDNGVVMLPPARVSTPPPTKPSVRLSWDQALAICAACRKPYNLTLKLMLHVGWGIGEFLKFNTPETWRNVEAYLKGNPNAEHFRFEFAGRKKNRRQFYSLIPTPLLKDILANLQVPIKASYGFTFTDSPPNWRKRRKYKSEGIPLDLAHYNSSRTYLEVAFKTALKHAPIIVQGNPSVHELRDTFRTRASLVQCADEAAEFAMGHSVDPLGYRKAVYDEDWTWGQLRKIYGPQAASRDELEAARKEAADLKRDLQDQITSQGQSINTLNEIIKQDSAEIGQLRTIIHERTKPKTGSKKTRRKKPN